MNPPSQHKNEVKTVAELLRPYSIVRYDNPNGIYAESENDWNEAEAAINAHIVSVLEELKGKQEKDHVWATRNDDGGDEMFAAVRVSSIDAAISKYKTKAQGETVNE